MSINLERRLERIEENLRQKRIFSLDMSDDELAQVILGDTGAKAGDLTDDQLEVMTREAGQ
jgi:hypothetical protein